ncbi:hypothetical protein LTR85_008692 [Meristemomyces frigidus]|nr:hypothetical protein LTR85_008692 [Meristemomyces frigidus]
MSRSPVNRFSLDGDTPTAPFSLSRTHSSAYFDNLDVARLPSEQTWIEDDPAIYESVSESRLLRVFADRPNQISDKNEPLEPVERSAKAPVKATKKTDDADGVRDLPTPPNLEELSLSPNHSRSTAYRRSLSPFRSPSVEPTSSSYKDFALETMRGDTSYNDPPAENVRRVVELISKGLLLSDVRTRDKKGWVYVVRDPDLDLIKFGSTARDIAKRLREERNRCRPSSPALEIIWGPETAPLQAFAHLEKLVHADLAPHRFYFDCKCGRKKQKGYTTHEEWFNISNEMAIETMRLWRSFMDQEPYGHLVFGVAAKLQSQWTNRLAIMRSGTHTRDHNDHESRLQRWANVFSVESMATAASPPRYSNIHRGEDWSVGADAIVPPTIGVIQSQQPSIKLESESGAGELMANLSMFPGSEQPVPSIERLSPSLDEGESGSVSPQPRQGSSDREWLGVSATARTDLSVDKPIEPTPDALQQKIRETTGGITHGRPDSGQPDFNGLQPSIEPRADKAPAYFDSNEANSQSGGAQFLLPEVLGSDDFTIEKLYRHFHALLRQERPAIPKRSILDDLHELRWPLACLVLLALHAPYTPPVFSLLVRTVFLPLIVAELRGWV